MSKVPSSRHTCEFVGARVHDSRPSQAGAGCALSVASSPSSKNSSISMVPSYSVDDVEGVGQVLAGAAALEAFGELHQAAQAGTNPRCFSSQSSPRPAVSALFQTAFASAASGG